MVRPNIFISGRELVEMGMCPFADPGYYIDNDAPCPICGALGDDDSADTKCINNGVLERENG